MKGDIIVFGRGVYYQAKRVALQKEFHVVAYLDNNAKLGDSEEGIPVYRPEELSNLPPYQIVIMTSR